MVVIRQELVKDPKTGKSEYKDVYEVKDIPNLRLDKKLSKTLYIPPAPPPREVKYLRPVKAHHISLEKKYPEPKAKFGDLEAYKKSRILDIAKKVYDLPEKTAKKFDKDDLIQFINDAYKERKIKPEKYTKTKVKLAKIEEIKPSMFDVLPSLDPTKPWKKRIVKGALSIKGTKKETAEEKMARSLPAHYPPELRTVGHARPFNPRIYADFKAGVVNPKFLADEIATHTDMSDRDKIMLQFLDDKQLKKLYKKAYKQSLKPETEKFSEKIYMPKLHHQKVANFAAPVEILDYTGTPHVVGRVKQPLAYTELESFNPKDYMKSKDQKKIEKIKKALSVIDVHGIVEAQKAVKGISVKN